MGDIVTTNMDVDTDYATSAVSDAALSGVSDMMDILLDANRPIRPNLGTLIQPGLYADYTEAQFSAIHDVITSGMDVSYELPPGAHGAWGAVQNYAGEALEGTIQWSFDNFTTVMKSYGITEIEYIIGSGVPAPVPLGVNDSQAGVGTRGQYDIKFIPSRGITYEENNLLGLEGHGWDEVDQQYGKLKVTVYDCFGNPVYGDNVIIDTTGDVLITNAVGIAIYEVPAQTLDVTGLRGSKSKTAIIDALAQTDLTFSYTGFVVMVLDGYNFPVIGTVVNVEEVDGGDEVYNVAVDSDGVANFPWLKLSTNYKITVLHYYRTEASGDEGIPMYFTFSEATLPDWTPPGGYPATIGYFIVYVKDAITARAVENLRLQVTDGMLTWQFISHLGRGAIIVPASNAAPIPMTVEIITGADRRYKGFKEEYTLTESEVKVYDVELQRREVSGTH